jgi:choline-sulfatase
VPAQQPWQEVYAAGPGATEELEVDDLAQERALAFLRDPARQAKPWALNVSFIAPHFPLVAPQRFWDMYPPDEMDLPQIPDGHLDNLHPMAQRLRVMFGFPQFPDDVVRRARAGYYALISYFDEKIGGLLDALVETGQYEDTIIIHISDHGDMNGEHGMWRKSNFYEASSRVPLQVSWPGRIAGGQRFAEVVSLVDVAATICDIAGDNCDLPLDGDSLLPLLTGDDSTWKDEAFCEYLAHGSDRPLAMLRRGRYKLNYSWGDPVELYDLEADPGEFHDLAPIADYQELVADMTARLLADWDPAALDKQVRASQRRQKYIEDRFGTGWRASSTP